MNEIFSTCLKLKLVEVV